MGLVGVPRWWGVQMGLVGASPRVTAHCLFCGRGGGVVFRWDRQVLSSGDCTLAILWKGRCWGVRVGPAGASPRVTARWLFCRRGGGGALGWDRQMLFLG